MPDAPFGITPVGVPQQAPGEALLTPYRDLAKQFVDKGLLSADSPTFAEDAAYLAGDYAVKTQGVPAELGHIHSTRMMAALQQPEPVAATTAGFSGNQVVRNVLSEAATGLAYLGSKVTPRNMMRTMPGGALIADTGLVDQVPGIDRQVLNDVSRDNQFSDRGVAELAQETQREKARSPSSALVSGFAPVLAGPAAIPLFTAQGFTGAGAEAVARRQAGEQVSTGQELAGATIGGVTMAAAPGAAGLAMRTLGKAIPVGAQMLAEEAAPTLKAAVEGAAHDYTMGVGMTAGSEMARAASGDKKADVAGATKGALSDLTMAIMGAMMRGGGKIGNNLADARVEQNAAKAQAFTDFTRTPGAAEPSINRKTLNLTQEHVPSEIGADMGSVASGYNAQRMRELGGNRGEPTLPAPSQITPEIARAGKELAPILPREADANVAAQDAIQRESLARETIGAQDAEALAAQDRMAAAEKVRADRQAAILKAQKLTLLGRRQAEIDAQFEEAQARGNPPVEEQGEPVQPALPPLRNLAQEQMDLRYPPREAARAPEAPAVDEGPREVTEQLGPGEPVAERATKPRLAPLSPDEQLALTRTEITRRFHAGEINQAQAMDLMTTAAKDAAKARQAIIDGTINPPGAENGPSPAIPKGPKARRQTPPPSPQEGTGEIGPAGETGGPSGGSNRVDQPGGGRGRAGSAPSSQEGEGQNQGRSAQEPVVRQGDGISQPQVGGRRRVQGEQFSPIGSHTTRDGRVVVDQRMPHQEELTALETAERDALDAGKAMPEAHKAGLDAFNETARKNGKDPVKAEGEVDAALRDVIYKDPKVSHDIDSRQADWSTADGTMPEAAARQTRLAASDVVAPAKAGEPAPAAPKAVKNPLNRGGMKAQVEALPVVKANPGLADVVMGLVDARAAAAGEDVNDYISRRIKGVESSDRVTTAAGALGTLKDGRAVLRAFSSANPSTPVHELMHLFRRDLTGADEDAAAKWAGAKKNAAGQWVWTTKAEENFAKAGERYIHTGIAPTPGLKGLFERAANFMRQVYHTIKGSEIEGDLTPEMKATFDKLLGEPKSTEGGKPAGEYSNLRPDLATPGTDPDARKAYVEDRNKVLGSEKPPTDEGLFGRTHAAEKEKVKADPKSALDDLKEKALSNAGFTFEDQARLQALTEHLRETSPDSQDYHDANRIYMVNASRSAALSLGIRMDRVDTPAERIAHAQARNSTPSPKTHQDMTDAELEIRRLKRGQKELFQRGPAELKAIAERKEKIEKALAKPGVADRVRLEKELEALNKELAKSPVHDQIMKKIKTKEAELKALQDKEAKRRATDRAFYKMFGYDLDDPNGKWASDVDEFRALLAAMDVRNEGWPALVREYQLVALHSSPAVLGKKVLADIPGMVVYFGGKALNTVIAEGRRAIGVRGNDEASFQEFGKLLHQIGPGLRQAASDAAYAWKYERLPSRLLSEEDKYHAIAIPGKLGKVLRAVPGFITPVRSIDAFVKSFISHIEVQSQAHRSALDSVGQPLTGDAYAAHMAKELKAGSQSWAKARDAAMWWTYTKPALGSELLNRAKYGKPRNLGEGVVKFIANWRLPIYGVPTNLVTQGLTHWQPGISDAWTIAKAVYHPQKGFGWHLKGNDFNSAVEQAALRWGLFFLSGVLLADKLKAEDDDLNPHSFFGGARHYALKYAGAPIRTLTAAADWFADLVHPVPKDKETAARFKRVVAGAYENMKEAPVIAEAQKVLGIFAYSYRDKAGNLHWSSPDAGPADYLARSIPIPSVLTRVEGAVEGEELHKFEVDKKADFPTQLGQILKQRVTGPTGKDSTKFGRPVERETFGNKPADAANKLMSPLPLGKKYKNER